jgi:hypothetical protein
MAGCTRRTSPGSTAGGCKRQQQGQSRTAGGRIDVSCPGSRWTGPEHDDFLADHIPATTEQVHTEGMPLPTAGEPTAGEQPSGGDRPRTYLPSVTGTVTLYRANTSRWSAMRRRRPRRSLAAAMAAVSASSLSAVLLATPSAQAVSAQALSFARAASGGPTGISAVAGELVNARTGKDMWARQEIEVVFLAGGASRSVAAASWMVN